jgi:hypothetical protein
MKNLSEFEKLEKKMFANFCFPNLNNIKKIIKFLIILEV